MSRKSPPPIEGGGYFYSPFDNKSEHAPNAEALGETGLQTTAVTLNGLNSAASITNISPFSKFSAQPQDVSPMPVRSSDNTTNSSSSGVVTREQLVNLVQSSGLYQESDGGDGGAGSSAVPTSAPKFLSSFESQNHLPIARDRTDAKSSISSGAVDWSGEIPKAMSRVLGADLFPVPEKTKSKSLESSQSNSSTGALINDSSVGAELESASALQAAIAAALGSTKSTLPPAPAASQPELQPNDIINSKYTTTGPEIGGQETVQGITLQQDVSQLEAAMEFASPFAAAAAAAAGAVQSAAPSVNAKAVLGPSALKRSASTSASTSAVGSSSTKSSPSTSPPSAGRMQYLQQQGLPVRQLSAGLPPLSPSRTSLDRQQQQQLQQQQALEGQHHWPYYTSSPHYPLVAQRKPSDSVFMPSSSTLAPDGGGRDASDAQMSAAAIAAAQVAAMHAMSPRGSLDEVKPNTPPPTRQYSAASTLISPRLSLDSPAFFGSGAIGASSFFPTARYSMSLESSEGRGSDEYVRNPTLLTTNNIITAGTTSYSPPSGIIPQSNLPRSDTALQALKHLQLSSINPFNQSTYPAAAATIVRSSGPRVTALVSAGGRFVRATGAGGGRGLGYEGGDVRLVSLPEGCSHAELVTALSKTATTKTTSSSRVSAGAAGGASGSIRAGSSLAALGGNLPQSKNLSGGGGGMRKVPSTGIMNHFFNAALASRFADLLPRFCIVRYQLPSDVSVWVDVVDDDDVALMFDEVAEIKKALGVSAPKLHIFVEWLSAGDRAGDRGHEAGMHSLGSAEFGGAFSGFLPASSSSFGSDVDETNMGYGDINNATGTAGGDLHSAHRSAQDLQLAAARTDHLEIIPPQEVTLIELLGTGSFGDMYKGYWRECEVSVKCLNPVMMGLQYSSKAAWLQFLQEANRAIGALRHPNLVEVYGIVLPASMDPRPSQTTASVARLQNQQQQQQGISPCQAYANNMPNSVYVQRQQSPQVPNTNLNQPMLLQGISSAPAIPGVRTGIHELQGYNTTLPVGGGVLQQIQQQYYAQQQAPPLATLHQRASSSGSLSLSAANGALNSNPQRLLTDFGLLSSNPSSTFASNFTTAGPAAAAATAASPIGPQKLPGPVQQMPAIVMEYVRGQSLDGAIRKHQDIVAGKLTRVLYAMDCARAVSYLHSKGIVHMHLKSGNVLLSWRNKRPMAKVAGYGLNSSKGLAGSYTPGVTTSRTVLPWIAPEIIRAPEKVSYKADVYSFGIIMWELWSLQPYFIHNMCHEEIVKELFNTTNVVRPPLPGTPGCASAAEPGFGWRELMQRCWAEDPDARPEMADVAEELKVIAKAVKDAQKESAGHVAGSDKNAKKK